MKPMLICRYGSFSKVREKSKKYSIIKNLFPVPIKPNESLEIEIQQLSPKMTGAERRWFYREQQR